VNTVHSYEQQYHTMSLVCAISNEVPEDAVVSPSSGAVFERRLIEKYIKENGKDPLSGDDLSVEQLIALKVPTIVKPRPPTATSIPAILKCLQDEWDSVMLNSFTVRKQLQTTRQELSHALYQHDAACRVIARLIKEVSAAREALATLKPKYHDQAENGAGKNGHSADANGFDELDQLKFIEKLESKAAILTAERKKRGKQMPEALVKPDAIREFKTVSSFSGLHSTSTPGILCVDICPTDSNLIVTGGNDKNAVVFNRQTEQIVGTLKGHSKKVTSVISHPNQSTAITASPDSTIRLWNVANGQATGAIRAHDGPITAISLHATGDYLLSTSTDEHWAFSDIHTEQVLIKLADLSSEHALTTAQFHPDGLIFSCGTSDSLIKIWDLKDKTNVANFPGHTGAITALTFSENGYYLATAAEDGQVKLWDLRKLKNFKTITMEENYSVKDLTFDRSGTYLGVAGTDVRVYLCKQWDNLCTFADHTAMATGIRFGENASYVASTGLDRTLKVYA
jgi:pre-mRNA-processing factor 19